MTNISIILVIYLFLLPLDMPLPKPVSRRVIMVHWKDKAEPFEIFSNLKLFCLLHPRYSYNTLNNYLSKNKVPFENERIRVERKVVKSSVPQRKIAPVLNTAFLKDHDEESEDLKYWLTKTPQERIGAVTYLRSQFMKPGQRMDKTFGRKVIIKR